MQARNEVTSSTKLMSGSCDDDVVKSFIMIKAIVAHFYGLNHKLPLQCSKKALKLNKLPHTTSHDPLHSFIFTVDHNSLSNIFCQHELIFGSQNIYLIFLQQFQKNSRFLLSLSVSIILSCLHSTVYRGMPPWIGSLVLNFGRGLCGLSLGYCIIASKNGHDSECLLFSQIICLSLIILLLISGFISRFLSLPIFVHLNKLSYAIYLLNPIIIIFFFGTIDGSFHLDPVVMVVLTFGITIMTYCAALVCSLFFELPYYKLSSTILKRSAVKKKSS